MCSAVLVLRGLVRWASSMDGVEKLPELVLFDLDATLWITEVR